MNNHLARLAASLVMLSWYACASAPGPAPKAASHAPSAAEASAHVLPTPAESIAAPAVAEVACLDARPPTPLRPEVEAFERLAADSSAPRDERATAAFDGARKYFEAEDWANAARLFRLAALEGTSAARQHDFSIPLYIEALNMLVAKRPTCLRLMHEDVERLLERHCTPGSAKLAEACNLLRRVRFGLRREQAMRATSQADASDARADWQEAAALFQAVFEDECVGVVSTPPTQCDEVGFNAGRVLLRNGDRAGAQKVLAQLRDPNNHIANRALIQLLECEIAGRTREDCGNVTTQKPSR